MKEITFVSHGVTCAAWHVSASDALAGPQGRPCVVMAHGFGGTRDSGLLNFAQAFAAAGIDAFVFDYRGFGASGGELRQHVSFRKQRADYHAAIATARNLPGVDPDRVAVWGTSYSGGHVVAVAAKDPRIAAVVAMNPATDGFAALVQLGRYAGVGQIVRATGHGLRDVASAVVGRTHHMRVVGQPGTTAVLSTPGAEESYTAMAGSTWRNEVTARTALEIALNRPIAGIRRVQSPLLVQAGSRDAITPAAPARTAARKASRGELVEYPIDHFDFYEDSWRPKVVADQLEFLTRVLSPATVRS